MLTCDEVLTWASYRARYGPLAMARRIEILFAHHYAQQHALHGGKERDFQSWLVLSLSDESELTLDQAMSEWC